MDMIKGILCETAEKYGWNNLNDLDLLTIVTGNHDSAVVLRDYLRGNTCTVEGLLNLNIEGMGRSTAMKIKALHALFTRKTETKLVSAKNSVDIYNAIAPHLTGLDEEQVWLMLIDQAGNIRKKMMISKGSFDMTLLDVRIIVKKALEGNCSAVAIAHNHLGGSKTPSAVDIKTTEEILKGCQLMRIRLVDHIIVAEDGFYSFSDDDKL